MDAEYSCRYFNVQYSLAKNEHFRVEFGSLIILEGLNFPRFSSHYLILMVLGSSFEDHHSGITAMIFILWKNRSHICICAVIEFGGENSWTVNLVFHLYESDDEKKNPSSKACNIDYAADSECRT